MLIARIKSILRLREADQKEIRSFGRKLSDIVVKLSPRGGTVSLHRGPSSVYVLL